MRSSSRVLEALVLGQLEKYLVVHWDRLRKFEVARVDIVTFVEAKFGLGIRDSKPSDTVTQGQSDPMDVDAAKCIASGKGKGSIESKRRLFQVLWSTFSTRLQWKLCSRPQVCRLRWSKNTFVGLVDLEVIFH